MVAYFDALWERLSGSPQLDASLLHVTRKRLLTFTALLTIVIATVWVVLTSGSVIGGRPFVAFLCALTPFAFAPFPYLALRSKINLDLLCHAYLFTLYLIVTLTAGALGGVVSTTSFFLMLLPLLGTLLLGVRVGLIWVLVVTLTYAGLHLAREVLPPSSYEALGAAPNDWMRMEEVSFWNAAMMTLLALAASLSVANFRAVVGKSSALLIEAANNTKDARQGQTAAEELARSKSEFMANVSHELRTPLNAIIGYSEMLIEDADDGGAGEAAADNRRVLEAALKLRSMVNDVLKLAAIDAGKISIDLDECRPTEFVQEAVDTVEPLARAKGNEIHVVDTTEPGVWLTDGERLGLCLRGLLSNATRSTANGRIEIRISQRVGEIASWLVIEIEDNGVSLDPNRLEQLFEPFSQPESAQTRHFEGMGLGLALSQRVARLLGGDVSASCAAPGGACFRVEIPARFFPAAASAAPQRAA
jgi:signal transduction histidine kinase